MQKKSKRIRGKKNEKREKKYKMAQRKKTEVQKVIVREEKVKEEEIKLVGWILWHINICRLFNVESCVYILMY